MEARIGNPAFLVPDAMPALIALGKATAAAGVSPRTQALLHLRASQINGCAVCLDMHYEELRRSGESERRLATVAAWRESPEFTDAERAALALCEAVTRLADRPDPVPGPVWDEAARHYGEKELGALVMTIAMINLWNRLNRATGQIAGSQNA
jgi:AhpD family alkylhydroperoxidase